MIHKTRGVLLALVVAFPAVAAIMAGCQSEKEDLPTPANTKPIPPPSDLPPGMLGKGGATKTGK